MDFDKTYIERMIQFAHDSSGNVSFSWALEAIAVSLYRIANALEALQEMAATEPTQEEKRSRNITLNF